jgi:hypothetical protein
MITKNELAYKVVNSFTGERVPRPHNLGFYTQVDTTESYRDMMRPDFERWGAELRVGVNYNVDPMAPKHQKTKQQEDMASSLHEYLYGGVRRQLYQIIDDVRMASPDPYSPALTKLRALLDDLS